MNDSQTGPDRPDNSAEAGDSSGIVFSDPSFAPPPPSSLPSSSPPSSANPFATNDGFYLGGHGVGSDGVVKPPCVDPSRKMKAIHWISALLLLVVADVAMFSGQGFTGLAFLFFVAPLLILIAGENRKSILMLMVLLMLVVAAIRMIWFGNYMLGLCGFVLIFSMSLVASGYHASFANVFLNFMVAPVSGIAHLFSLRIWASSDNEVIRKKNSIASLVIPLVAITIFGSIFVFANPDLLASVSRLLNIYNSTLFEYVPSFAHYCFWGVVGVFAVGLIRPLSRFGPPINASFFHSPESNSVAGADEFECKQFEVFRNTLFALIILFIVYLIFEFSTLWFREFPDGFYYAGYAHQGAAWLTFALLLTTATLSLIFRGDLYSDPRIKQIWTLATVWIGLNFVLALAVYNRMWIYIDFNGLTYMRMIGLFGISTVCIGMILVIIKMRQRKSFAWLVSQDLIALFVACFLFCVIPIHSIWVSYNVARVRDGDLPPSIQLVAHPIGDDGIYAMSKLLEHPEEKIREGARAILWLRLCELKTVNTRRSELGWTAYQMGSEALENRLNALDGDDQFATINNIEEAQNAKQRFFDYAFQWY